MKKGSLFSKPVFENMFQHITINIAYPAVTNDDDVCVLFVSLFAQSNE
ncbi:MAG: hypothetical protein ABI863_07630 [Ginsengibacter sp.]